jgi:hypothetical protein
VSFTVGFLATGFSPSSPCRSAVAATTGLADSVVARVTDVMSRFLFVLATPAAILGRRSDHDRR